MLSNPYADVHGDGDVYTWSEAPGYVLNAGAIGDIETAFGATLMALSAATPVDGFIVAEEVPGEVRVTVHLYRSPCTDVNCPGRHVNPLKVSPSHPAKTPASLDG